MSRRRLAFAPALPSRSAPTVSPKVSHESRKKSGRRGGHQRRREAFAAPSPSVWTDVEEAFFAAAPPDEPASPAEPESFDDLGTPARQGSGGSGSTGGNFWSALRRLFARPSGPFPRRS